MTPAQRFDGYSLSITGALMALVFALVFLGACTITIQPAPQIAQCPEDSVLVGLGDFDHGRYERYVCGPAMDDYAVAP